MATTNPQEIFENMPRITRAWLVGAICSTAAVSFGLISYAQLMWHPTPVWQKFQIWRCFTNFLFFGKFSFGE